MKGEDVTELASMAKLKAGRLSREVSDACLQYWGGMGFTGRPDLARLSRQAAGLHRRRRRRDHAVDHLQAHGHLAGQAEQVAFPLPVLLRMGRGLGEGQARTNAGVCCRPSPRPSPREGRGEGDRCSEIA